MSVIILTLFFKFIIKKRLHKNEKSFSKIPGNLKSGWTGRTACIKFRTVMQKESKVRLSVTMVTVTSLWVNDNNLLSNRN